MLVMAYCHPDIIHDSKATVYSQCLDSNIYYVYCIIDFFGRLHSLCANDLF